LQLIEQPSLVAFIAAVVSVIDPSGGRDDG